MRKGEEKHLKIDCRLLHTTAGVGDIDDDFDIDDACRQVKYKSKKLDFKANYTDKKIPV